MPISATTLPALTIGLDLGDRHSRLCALTAAGEIVEESRLPTTRAALEHRFRGADPARVVLEVGTHSPWVCRLLKDCGHEVVLANPRKLRLIYENDRKCDRVDAEYLARLGRADPALLAPLAHRAEQTQADLVQLRSRDVLVRSRTQLINHVRGTCKTRGVRLPKCSSRAFAQSVRSAVPEALAPALDPVLAQIAELTRVIKDYEKQLQQIAQERYPETTLLTQVPGVGPITALCFVLTLEDPARFPSSRRVGAYLGLVPRCNASGGSDPQLRISKAGDGMLRRLLIQCSHYILGPFGPDTDLRRWGLRLQQRGGKNAKKRAAVALARKLAVLLHHLWCSAEVYEPLRSTAAENRKAEANPSVAAVGQAA